MNIISIVHKEHISPKGSCGTGYSEPDIFSVTLDNGKEYTVTIDIWYLPKENIKRKFEWEIYRQVGFEPDNLSGAYEMYAKIIALKSCPYSFKELISG